MLELLLDLEVRINDKFGYFGIKLLINIFSGIGGGRLPRYLQYTQFKVLSRSQCYLGQEILCSQPQSGSSSLEGGDSGKETQKVRKF